MKDVIQLLTDYESDTRKKAQQEMKEKVQELLRTKYGIDVTPEEWQSIID